MTKIMHWGKFVDSESPVTGVLSLNSVNWDCMDEDTCLTCQEITNEIMQDDTLDEDEKQNQLEYMECDSSHDKIIGDWLQDDKGLYYPNPAGEYAAILREDVIQVVYSTNTARGTLCSPCYPGQVDLDSTGEFLAYTLPDDMLYKDH